MIAIVNYGVGNLFSLQSSLDYLGIVNAITNDPAVLETADRIILPGVGAFGDAMAKLRASGLDQIVMSEAKKGKPILGICLGMQMLFERSMEFGEHEGLGLLKGEVVPLKGAIPDSLKVPQMGWNNLQIRRASPLLAGIGPNPYVYYVHSYYVRGNGDNLVADSDYGVAVPGVVQKKNILGAQFHPEKSGKIGLKMLANFDRLSQDSFLEEGE